MAQSSIAGYLMSQTQTTFQRKQHLSPLPNSHNNKVSFQSPLLYSLTASPLSELAALQERKEESEEEEETETNPIQSVKER